MEVQAGNASPGHTSWMCLSTVQLTRSPAWGPSGEPDMSTVLNALPSSNSSAVGFIKVPVAEAAMLNLQSE